MAKEKDGTDTGKTRRKSAYPRMFAERPTEKSEKAPVRPRRRLTTPEAENSEDQSPSRMRVRTSDEPTDTDTWKKPLSVAEYVQKSVLSTVLAIVITFSMSFLFQETAEDSEHILGTVDSVRNFWNSLPWERQKTLMLFLGLPFFLPLMLVSWWTAWRALSGHRVGGFFRMVVTSTGKIHMILAIVAFGILFSAELLHILGDWFPGGEEEP